MSSYFQTAMFYIDSAMEMEAAAQTHRRGKSTSQAFADITTLRAPRLENCLDPSMKRWHSKHNPQIALTPDEMLEISQEISQGYAPNREGEAQELVLLPVDPYHMYAYWNLEEEKGRPSDLTLRVYWYPEEDRSTKESKLWFDVALQGYRNQCQVQLPIDETAYSAELGRYDPE